MKTVYAKAQRPTRYDGARFIVYLGGKAVRYKETEDSEESDGIEYNGPMGDGGTLIECDAWNRDKLIGGIIRSRYLQTEEDAIKTHQIQLLQTLSGMEGGELSDGKKADYEKEWKEFQSFRQEAIDLVDSWDDWSE